MLKQALRVALFLYVTVLCCPVEFFAPEPTVDGSWQLGLNVAADQGLRFGEDIEWPSGPFAYLDSPMPVGDNLEKALAAQLALWALAALALADLFFMRRLPLGGLAALAAGVAIGAPLFHFNTQGSDSLLTFTAMTLASSAVTAEKWRGRLFGAAMAAGLAGAFKVSAAVIGGAGAATAALLLWRKRDLGPTPLALVAVTGPCAVVAAYLLHNPSLQGLANYLGSLRDLSAGYSSAMAFGDSEAQVQAALVVAALFVAILRHLWSRGQTAAVVATLFLAPLFLTFKHAFVRQDIHMWMFFCFLSLALGLTLAFTDWRKLDRTLMILALGVILPINLMMSYLSAVGWTGISYTKPAAILARTLSGAASLKHLGEAWDLQRTREALLARGRALHHAEGREIPQALVDRIGDRGVAALSPISGELFLQGLNVRVLPIVQKYSAYTPSLDAFLAQKLDHGYLDLLLFEWDAIDGRHPLIETPLTWAAVWRSFDCVAREGKWALLERRTTERFSPGETATPAVGNMVARIGIPEHQGPLFASIARKRSAAGRVVEGLYRMPQMQMQVALADGRVEQYRMFQAALESPLPLSPLPTNLDELAGLLAPDSVAEGAPQVRSVWFSGPGDAYYSTVDVALSAPAPGALTSAENGAE